MNPFTMNGVNTSGLCQKQEGAHVSSSYFHVLQDVT